MKRTTRNGSVTRRSAMSPGATTTALLAIALVTSAPALTESHAQAQDGRNIALEGRVGTTFPVGDLADVGGESGLAATVDLLINLTPRWSAYAGWGIHDFNCDGCPDDLGSSAGHAGAKYIFDWEGDALPWTRAGLVYGQATALQDDMDVESDRSLGLELASGIDFRINDRISLVPNLSFIYYSADLPVEDYSVTYFLLDLGAHYHF